MNLNVFVIWVGIIAGSLLTVFFIIIVSIRKPRVIQKNDLIMLLLATVLIVFSQFSEISVGHLLTLKTDFKKLEKTVARSENKVVKLENTVDKSKNKVEELITTVGTSEAKLENLYKATESSKEDLTEIYKEIEAFNKNMAETRRDMSSRFLKIESYVKQQTQPRPGIRPEPPPELMPKPQPETPPEIMPEPRPGNRPESRLETLPFKQ